MKRVVVVGAGGHAKVVVSTLQAAGYEVAALLDHDPAKKDVQILGVPVVTSLSSLRNIDEAGGVIAVGDNRVRERIASELKLNWIHVVHPTAYVHESVRLGGGTVVFAGAVIQPDSVIGDHVIVNTGATIDHDCEIGDFVHIAPGVNLAGNVFVGRRSFLGIGSVVIPGKRIGRGVTIGAGAVVIRDVEDNAVVYGVPARSR